MPKSKQTTLSATFPNVMSFTDYHEIDGMAGTLTELFGTKIRGSEEGYCFGGYYIGVFYVGRKPAMKIINTMIEQIGLELMIDD